MIAMTQVPNNVVRLAIIVFLIFAGGSLVAGIPDPGGSVIHGDDVLDEPRLSVPELEALRDYSRHRATEAAFALGIVALDRKDTTAAQALLEEAMRIDPNNSDYLGLAASLSFYRGDFAQAQACQLRRLELARAALGPRDIRIAMLMDELGTIYLARRHYTQAEFAWMTSLDIYERMLGTAHPALAPILNELAGLMLRDGRFGETEELLKRAVQIFSSNTYADRLDLAAAQHNLADFYVHRQRTSEAELLYAQALTEWKSTPAQQRFLIAASLNEAGHGYLEQRRSEEAESQFRLVINLLADEFGDHPEVLRARAALTELKSRRQKPEERVDVKQTTSGMLLDRSLAQGIFM